MQAIHSELNVPIKAASEMLQPFELKFLLSACFISPAYHEPQFVIKIQMILFPLDSPPFPIKFMQLTVCIWKNASRLPRSNKSAIQRKTLPSSSQEIDTLATNSILCLSILTKDPVIKSSFILNYIKLQLNKPKPCNSMLMFVGSCENFCMLPQKLFALFPTLSFISGLACVS